MPSIRVASWIFAAVMACLAIEPAFAATSIRIESAGEYLGQGQTIEITDADSTFDVSVGTDNSISVNTSFEGWSFSFANVGEEPLVEGAYEEATRYPFQSGARPGLSASGDGRGCNTLTGRFAVLEVEYGAGDEIVRLAVDLSLRCDNDSGLFEANIRINSDLPLTLEMPTASAGRDRIVFERDNVMLDATQSVGGDSSIATYQWTQTAGAIVNLSSTSSSTLSFEAPDVAGPPVLLNFEVEVVNNNDLIDTDVVTIEVRDRSQSRSYLSYVSSPGDPIGSGESAFFTEDDGVFTGSTVTDGRVVNIRFDGNDGWDLGFTAPDGQALTGSTSYTVTSDASNPDLSVTHAGSACAVDNGTFFVYSYTQAPGVGELGSFSADFDQACANSSGSLVGEIHYQTVLPEANAGPSRAELESVAIVLDPALSMDAEGSIEQYQWNQLSGPAVSLDPAGDGTATFTYALGDTELEQLFEFELIVTDELGHADTDSVTVTVIQDNQAPVASDDLITLQQGFTFEFNPLANDTDSDGQIDVPQLLIVDAPVEGSLFNSAAGFTYISTSDFTGTTTATYVVYDNDDAESNVATITLEVTPGPVGNTDLGTTESGVPITIDVLANDQTVDAPFNPATVSIIGALSNGSVIVNGDGSVTYTPSASFSGQDSFRYDVSDNNGLRIPPAIVSIIVTAPAGQQPSQPSTPATPAAPDPVQVTAAVPEPEVCSDINALTGATKCGNGSFSFLDLLALGFLLARLRHLKQGR